MCNHVRRAMDLNGRSGEPQGWQWTLSLGSVGSSSHSLHSFHCCHVASREAQISGAADHVHVTFSTDPQIGQLPR
jgi:hypothetical protein